MHIKYNVYIKPKCKVCGKNYTKFTGYKNILYANCCCKECEKEYRKIQTIKAIKEKYGVENISQLDEIKKKKKETFNNNYPKGSNEYKELIQKE